MRHFVTEMHIVVTFGFRITTHIRQTKLLKTLDEIYLANFVYKFVVLEGAFEVNRHKDVRFK